MHVTAFTLLLPHRLEVTDAWHATRKKYIYVPDVTLIFVIRQTKELVPVLSLPLLWRNSIFSYTPDKSKLCLIIRVCIVCWYNSRFADMPDYIWNNYYLYGLWGQVFNMECVFGAHLWWHLLWYAANKTSRKDIPPSAWLDLHIKVMLIAASLFIPIQKHSIFHHVYIFFEKRM